MSVQSVALASLTATYTDSEGEDGVDDDLQENSNTPRGVAPQNAQVGQPQVLISPKSGRSASNSPINNSNLTGKSNNNLPSISTLVTETTTKVQRLVSYFDDTIVSDDEGTAVSASEGLHSLNGRPPLDTAEQQSPTRQDLISDNEADAYGVIIPPDPPGTCPSEVQEKIKNLCRKVESGRLDMSKLIQQRKEFRNPSIYEKLIQYCGINELGTNYAPDRFDPFKWGKDSYYEELAEVQIIEMKKLEKAKKEKSKVEIVSGTAKRPSSTTGGEEDAKKRKSKWDQVSTIPAAAAAVKPNVVAQPSLTTVISAFGSLPKKRL